MSQPGFARVLAAEGVSNFGSMLSRLAIPWWAALGLGATPLDMAALLVADVLASAAGGLLLAGWIDRRSKRSTMLLCDGLRAAALGVLAVAAWQGVANMAGLVLAAALNGVLTVGFELARSAWVAQQVPADELPRRNAQLSATGSLSETLAFAQGGWLYQALGDRRGPAGLVGRRGRWHAPGGRHRGLRVLAPPDERARADAGIRFAGQMATLLAALAGGLVGRALGARSALVAAVGLFAAAALVALRRRAVLRARPVAPRPLNSS